MLKIQNFTKIYPGSLKAAVENVSLQVEAGDLFAFIGHNGAGKTTLLKACAGIHPVEKGDIWVVGQSIKTHPVECKAQLAYIPDNPDLYEFLTGHQYLQFIADIFRLSKETRQTEIEKYAKLLDIQESLGEPISTYSHGMKQKLVLVSAFMHHPKLLLLDEPFVGLDPTVSYQLKQLMIDYCKEGNAIFFSTHVLEVAEKLCNKVAIISNGALLAHGLMEEVKGNKGLEQVFLELNTHE